MVELASYSSIDWADSAVNTVEAEALEPKSPEAKKLFTEDPAK
mgnify:CR=1 FL=1